MITLNGTANTSVDVSGTSLLEVGQAGVAASRPVFFEPGEFYTEGVQRRDPIFTAEAMAISISSSINAADAAGLFEEVAATPRDDQVILDGVADTNAGGSDLRSNIRDIAAVLGINQMVIVRSHLTSNHLANITNFLP